jgi:hypothetical protein
MQDYILGFVSAIFVLLVFFCSVAPFDFFTSAIIVVSTDKGVAMLETRHVLPENAIRMCNELKLEMKNDKNKVYCIVDDKR